MKVKLRILLEARYIISLNKKVKDLGKIFNVSKQTIYYDLKYRLKKIDMELYERVISVLNENKY